MRFWFRIRDQTECGPWHRKQTVQLCYHMFVAWMYFAAIYGYYDLPCKVPTIVSPKNYAGFWKFLTYWNIIVSFLFFAFSCITDTIQSDRMIKFRDTVFAGIVFPYGVFVSCMFWGVYAVNRELIFPKELDGKFPAWLNHISHTIQVPTLLLEVLIVHHKYPSRKTGFATNMGFGGVYLLWTFYLAFAKDIWVYEFVQDLPWYGKVIFFPACLAMQIIIYNVCERVDYYFGRFFPSSRELKRLYGKKV
ncbi:Androgen-induced protein 1 like [Argiope bruennichi]|uniref:Androgen-induced protein 1 like n=1 Tax=Argiope bruennichi TaxID=94029 RepID=A0A8T0EVQ5_ARGBR|nr:Androgen-induced protein 1 like [Argiope bruennichi]